MLCLGLQLRDHSWLCSGTFCRAGDQPGLTVCQAAEMPCPLAVPPQGGDNTPVQGTAPSFPLSPTHSTRAEEGFNSRPPQFKGDLSPHCELSLPSEPPASAPEGSCEARNGAEKNTRKWAESVIGSVGPSAGSWGRLLDKIHPSYIEPSPLAPPDPTHVVKTIRIGTALLDSGLAMPPWWPGSGLNICFTCGHVSPNLAHGNQGNAFSLAYGVNWGIQS